MKELPQQAGLRAYSWHVSKGTIIDPWLTPSYMLPGIFFMLMVVNFVIPTWAWTVLVSQAASHNSQECWCAPVCPLQESCFWLVVQQNILMWPGPIKASDPETQMDFPGQRRSSYMPDVPERKASVWPLWGGTSEACAGSLWTPLMHIYFLLLLFSSFNGINFSHEYYLPWSLTFLANHQTKQSYSNFQNSLCAIFCFFSNQSPTCLWNTSFNNNKMYNDNVCNDKLWSQNSLFPSSFLNVEKLFLLLKILESLVGFGIILKTWKIALCNSDAIWPLESIFHCGDTWAC